MCGENLDDLFFFFNHRKLEGSACIDGIHKNALTCILSTWIGVSSHSGNSFLLQMCSHGFAIVRQEFDFGQVPLQLKDFS